jgi:DNA-binding CsgD family transcriptional regulator/tetratricopeptide (TPR) repeat protein
VADGQGSAGFVGRTAELAQLESWLASAAAGAPRVVVLAGEAGVGKTRLLGRLIDQARMDGATVLDGACLPLGRDGAPYAPVVALLRSLRRAVQPGELIGLLGPGRGELARLVPELVDRAADLPGAPVDVASQARLFELVASTVERLARRSTVVLAVEDVQWIDRPSRDLLDFLVRGLRAERLLVVVTLRTDDPDADDATRRWLAELGRLPLVERLDLGPLSRAEVAVLVGRVLGHDAEPGLIDRIAARANGNAFLTEALAEAFAETTGRGAAGADTAMPERLRDLLLARLGGLDDTTTAVLRAASAAGRDVDDGLVADALSLPESTVHAAMRRAAAHGVLVRTTGDDDGPGHAFRHGLLREAVYQELFPRERRRLHAAFASALAARATMSPQRVAPAELAIHWDAAAEPRRALAAHVRAGRAASRVYAFGEAHRHYERAFVLWDEVEAAERGSAEDASEMALADLLEAAAEASAMDGDYLRAVDLIRIAMRAVDPRLEPARAGDLSERLRWFLWEAGDRPAAAAAVAEALRLIPASPPSTARARALAHAAGLEMLAGHPREALEGAEAALVVARAASGLPEEALALGVAGWATGMLGDVDQGVLRFREALRIAELLGSVEGLAIGYTNLVGLLDRAGRTSEALEAANEGYAAVERNGLVRTFGGYLLGHAARMLFHLGRWDEARASIARALADRPVPRAEAYVHIQRARLAAAAGDDETARDAIAAVAAIHERWGAGDQQAALVQATVERAVWAGDVPAARAAVDAVLGSAPAAELPDPALAWVVAYALRLEADVGEVARAAHEASALATALERGDRLATWFRRWLPGDDQDAGISALAPGDARAPAIVALCRAELDRLAGHPDPGAWAAVVSTWAALGRPLPEAYARYREGAALLATDGMRSVAREALLAGLAIAERLGAGPLARDVGSRLRLARLAIAPDPADAGDAARDGAMPDGREGHPDLTAREREVLRLVAAGWSNPEIAETLGISAKTASVHVSNILAKLGVANRVEAAVAAARLGYGPEA